MIINLIEKKSTHSFLIYRIQRIHTLFGIDKKYTETDKEVEQSKALYIKALKQVEGTLDLGYYCLGDM